MKAYHLREMQIDVTAAWPALARDDRSYLERLLLQIQTHGGVPTESQYVLVQRMCTNAARHNVRRSNQDAVNALNTHLGRSH